MTCPPQPIVVIDPALDGVAPRVSVVMSVFNNRPYITQAIESVLSQELDAPFELIAADDYSTDGTRTILEDYRLRFPGRVRLALARRNTGGVENFRDAVRASTADYIALIDGDDFWTARDKLRKQTAFLDEHPECSMCFHNVLAYHEDETSEPFDLRPQTNSGILGQRDLLERNYVVSCSPLIRTRILQALPDWVFELELGDWAIYVLATEHGGAGYLDEIMAVYRIHPAGAWSRKGRRGQLEGSIGFYEEIRARLSGRHYALIDRQRLICCQELRIYAWVAWTACDYAEAIRAWAALAQHDPQALVAELAYRFGSDAETDSDTSDSPSDEPCYEGFQENVDGHVVTGWAWNSRTPEAPVDIDILDGDTILGTVTADIFRTDLRDARKGRGYHAFAYRLPDRLRDGTPHRIETRIAGTSVRLTNSGAIVAFADPQRPHQHAAMREAELQWLNRDIEPYRAAEESLSADLIARNRQVVELRRDLEEARTSIARLRDQLAAIDSEPQRLHGKLEGLRGVETLLRELHEMRESPHRLLAEALRLLRRRVRNRFQRG